MGVVHPEHGQYIRIMSTFWTHALAQLKRELPATEFNALARTIRFEERADFKPVIVTSNRFQVLWVRDRYLARINELASEYFGTATRISIEPPPRKHCLESYPLIPEFIFENWIFGKSNSLAYAAALRVAQNPGEVHNPLLICGDSGLGKTHLVHAIGNTISRENPSLVVRHMESASFYANVVTADKDGTWAEFRRPFEKVDVLLMDALQFLGGISITGEEFDDKLRCIAAGMDAPKMEAQQILDNKSRSQEEFHLLVNAMIAAKKQIVVSVDRPPEELQGFDSRLLSGFRHGFAVQIHTPDLKLRVAFLKAMAKMEKVDLDDDIACFLANLCSVNFRDLAGSLKRLIAYANYHNRKIALSLAIEIFQESRITP